MGMSSDVSPWSVCVTKVLVGPRESLANVVSGTCVIIPPHGALVNCAVGIKESGDFVEDPSRRILSST